CAHLLYAHCVRCAHCVRFATFAALTLVRSLRSLLLKRCRLAPYQSEASERTNGRTPYKSDRSERTAPREASVPRRRPPTPLQGGPAPGDGITSDCGRPPGRLRPVRGGRRA